MTPQGFAKTPSATPHRVRSRSQPFGEEGLWSYGEDVGECAYECGGGVGECKHGSVCRVRMVEVVCVGGGNIVLVHHCYTNVIKFGTVDRIQE